MNDQQYVKLPDGTIVAQTPIDINEVLIDLKQQRDAIQQTLQDYSEEQSALDDKVGASNKGLSDVLAKIATIEATFKVDIAQAVVADDQIAPAGSLKS